MTTADLATFVLWFVVSFIAVFAGSMLAYAVWRRKQLPANPVFLTPEEPPLRPKMIVLTYHHETANPIFCVNGGKVSFDFRSLREPILEREVNSPRDLLRLCKDYAIQPVMVEFEGAISSEEALEMIYTAAGIE